MHTLRVFLHYGTKIKCFVLKQRAAIILGNLVTQLVIVFQNYFNIFYVFIFIGSFKWQRLTKRERKYIAFLPN